MPYTKQTWADSPATTSPITAARLAHLEDGIFTAQSTADSASGGAFFNIKSTGTVKGDGTTDDTAAINAAIAASPIGATVFFPAGTYLISGPIILYPSREYLGAGHALAGPSCATIKLKNAANPTAAGGATGMFVSQGWANNASVCDYPMRIRNFAFDGNRSNNPTSQAYAIVLCGFWSWIEDCYIVETSGGGILLTDTGIDGTTVVGNTCSENRILNTKITGLSGDGIRLVSGNSNSNLDGFLEGCLISYTSGLGLNFDRSAGWTFRRNHFYGIGDTAMWLGNTFATDISNNYIEDFGDNNATGAYYNGIGFNQLDGRGTTVIGNFVGTDEASVNTSYYYFIVANAGSYEANAQVIIANNFVSGNNGPRGYGITVGHGSNGAHMVAEVGLNHINNVTTPTSFDAADTVNLVSAGGGASSVAWTSITGKPTTFTPATHTHTEADVTGLSTDLAAKAPLASPAFTGTPSLPTGTTGITQSAGTSNTTLATTAFAAAAATAAQTASQPLDSDLSTIAALTATTDSIMQAKAGAWSARTLAQVATDLNGTGSILKSRLYNGSAYADASGALIFVGVSDPAGAAPNGSIWFQTAS